VEHPDDESSEWLSEWGDAPAGPSGFGPSKLRPGWKGGGEAPGPHDGRFRALPATASRGRPVPTAPRVGHEPHSLGIAGVEATLRRWLVTNRRVHEPRRLTLLRMLGRGLKGGTDSSLDRRTRFDPNDEYRHMDEENELVTDTDDDVHNATFTRGKTVNGLPVDAKGRPVGLKNASFPDPKYHAIDEETSEPLPLEERKRFVPSLPPSKRVYHPLGGRPGPRIRDGTWDSPIDVPRSLDLNDEPLDDRSAAAKRRPAVVMTKAQFARACALGGTPLSASDVDEVFAKYGRVSGGARAIDPNKTTAMSLELEAFAETIVSMPQRALGAKPHRALDDSPVNSMALRSESAEGKSVTKIVYPPCRTGVFAPSDWDDYYARRSADAPKEDLAAEWAYGCSVAGKCGMLAAAPKTWTDEPTRKADVHLRRRRIHGRMDEPGRVQGRGVGVRVRRDGRRVRCQRVAATLLPRARRRNYESNHARGGEVGGYWAAKRPRSLRVHLGDRHRERGGAASPRAGRARGGGDRLWSGYR